MDSWPDDVILHFIAFLGWDEAHRLRGICRRLRFLVDSYLWCRHVVFLPTTYSPPSFRTVCGSLTPLAGKLRLYSHVTEISGIACVSTFQTVFKAWSRYLCSVSISLVPYCVHCYKSDQLTLGLSSSVLDSQQFVEFGIPDIEASVTTAAANQIDDLRRTEIPKCPSAAHDECIVVDESVSTDPLGRLHTIVLNGEGDCSVRWLVETEFPTFLPSVHEFRFLPTSKNFRSFLPRGRRQEDSTSLSYAASKLAQFLAKLVNLKHLDIDAGTHLTDCWRVWRQAFTLFAEFGDPMNLETFSFRNWTYFFPVLAPLRLLPTGTKVRIHQLGHIDGAHALVANFEIVREFIGDDCLCCPVGLTLRLRSQIAGGRETPLDLAILDRSALVRANGVHLSDGWLNVLFQEATIATEDSDIQPRPVLPLNPPIQIHGVRCVTLHGCNYSNEFVRSCRNSLDFRVLPGTGELG